MSIWTPTITKVFRTAAALANLPQQGHSCGAEGSAAAGALPLQLIRTRTLPAARPSLSRLGPTLPCWPAAPSGARLVLVEWVIPETAAFDTGKWMDINMLVNAGGRERTATEFRELYDQAGFELEKIVATPSPLSIIIGKPRALGLP